MDCCHSEIFLKYAKRRFCNKIKYVQDSLEKLAKNRTTFVIAHRLSTIRNAEKILVLTENGIAEEGTHQQLLKQEGIYAGFYNMQFNKKEA